METPEIPLTDVAGPAIPLTLLAVTLTDGGALAADNLIAARRSAPAAQRAGAPRPAHA